MEKIFFLRFHNCDDVLTMSFLSVFFIVVDFFEWSRTKHLENDAVLHINWQLWKHTQGGGGGGGGEKREWWYEMIFYKCLF